MELYSRKTFKDAICSGSLRKVVSLSSTLDSGIPSGERYTVMAIVRELFTKGPGHRIILLAQDKNLNSIFNTIRKDIRCHPYLYGEETIQRDVSAPFLNIELKNGNGIRAFSIKKHWSSLCGQDANSIYVYENKLDEEIYTNYVYPILATTPDTKLEIVLASSGIPATNPKFISKLQNIDCSYEYPYSFFYNVS